MPSCIEKGREKTLRLGGAVLTACGIPKAKTRSKIEQTQIKNEQECKRQENALWHSCILNSVRFVNFDRCFSQALASCTFFAPRDAAGSGEMGRLVQTAELQVAASVCWVLRFAFRGLRRVCSWMQPASGSWCAFCCSHQVPASTVASPT